MNGLMIVGTDTGVGKTTLCELLLYDARERGEALGIYKPVCTGSEQGSSGEACWSDIERLHRASGECWSRDDICPQRFSAPAAPPVAAAAEGRQVVEAELSAGLDRWRRLANTVIVEGVGGLLCPVTDCLTIADLALRWSLPLIVVSANRLGTINHTLLTLETAQRRGIQVAGWVLNHTQPADTVSASNAGEIRKHTEVPLLGELAFAGIGELQSGRSSPRMFHGRGVHTLADLMALAQPIAMA